MFIARDLLCHDAAHARPAGASAMAFAGSLAAPAILGQIRQPTPGYLATLEPMSSRGPEAEGSAFSSAHEPSAPRIPSYLQNVLPARIPKCPAFSQLHSLRPRSKVTPAFPVTSTLLVRSLAPERKLTRLLSCSCALFRKNTRGRGVSRQITPKPQLRSFHASDSTAPRNVRLLLEGPLSAILAARTGTRLRFAREELLCPCL